MKSGKHKVTGYRSPDSYFCRFLVSYFTEEHYIRVLAHEISACDSKVIADFFIHLGLLDKAQLILDRVLDSNHISLQKVYLSQCSVQGRGFTTAGRSRYKDYPARLLEQRFYPVCIHFIKTQLIDPEQRSGPCKQPHHDILPIDSWHSRNTDIIILV